MDSVGIKGGPIAGMVQRRKHLTYRQALSRHSDCVVELGYRKVDTSYPDHASVPVATAPAIFVWADRQLAAGGDESRCLAIYWLRDSD
jgi:hypothetical protein